MKKSDSLRRPLSVLLAALLLGGCLATATACVGGHDPADTTPSDATGTPATGAPATEETLTLGEATTAAPSETAAPAETQTPEVDFTVPDSLIGDGSETVGVYPTFSEKGGLSTEATRTLTLTAPEGYTLRYTTDGSVPTKRSAAYEGPITLTLEEGEAAVIRAACFGSDGTLTGQVITHTYVRVAEVAAPYYTVMLSCDESDLNAMYRDVQAKVERAAHAEIIAPDGTRIISQDVGLRLFGGSSRGLEQKSFKIIARKDGYFGEEPYVGLGTFTYPFFPSRVVLGGKNQGKVLDKFDALILRNGGNDSLLSTAADPDRMTLLRDGVANMFAARYTPHVAASMSHFAVVYLNGEYYGVLELRENQNEDYVKRVWGVSDDDVVVVKSELDTTRACENHSDGGHCRFCGTWFFYETDEEAAAQAEMEAWIALCQKAAGAVNASEAEYRRVFAEVEAALDLTNVKEYVALACFLCNTDWPHNNIRVWRYTGEAVEGVSVTDGKWRFATRDMDFTMGRYTGDHPLPEIDTLADVDMFEWVLSNYVGGYGDCQQYEDALYLQGLFAFLMRDDGFRGEFADFCRTLAAPEATGYLMELYETAYEQVKPAMEAHIDRWSHRLGGFRYRNWTRACKHIATFIEDRPAAFLEDLERMLAMYE